MTFTLTCPKTYRLKISLKDIIDSQYNDQVFTHTNTQTHTWSNNNIHQHTKISSWLKNIKLRRKVCLFFQWFSLTDVKSGRVHLTLEWVPTASESQSLDQVGIFKLGREQISFKWFNGSFLFCAHRFFSSIPDSPSKTRQFPLQGYCLSWLSKQTVYRLVFTHDLQDRTSSCLLHIRINYDLLLCWKLKKSGKEPKVGAEVTLGKLSHKTTVRYRASLKWAVFIVIVI